MVEQSYLDFIDLWLLLKKSLFDRKNLCPVSKRKDKLTHLNYNNE